MGSREGGVLASQVGGQQVRPGTKAFPQDWFPQGWPGASESLVPWGGGEGSAFSAVFEPGRGAALRLSVA